MTVKFMACKEVVLHVGMHKTGTSSIQASLEDYDDGRIRYARLGPANQSNIFVNLFSDAPERHHNHVNHGRSKEQIREISGRQLKKLQFECNLDRDLLIFSGEDICLFNPHEVASIATFFSARKIGVNIIAYIREPIVYSSSAYAQIVRGGNRGEVAPMPAYRAQFRKFLDSFGDDRVTFVPYDKQLLPEGSVVADICKRLGISAGSRERTSNLSNAKAVTQLLYGLNRSDCRTLGSARLLKAREKLVELLDDRFTGKPLNLPTECIDLATNRSEFEWMATRLAGWPAMEQAARLAQNHRFSAGALDSFMRRTAPEVLTTLQHLVAESDPTIAQHDNETGLMIYLFQDIYQSVKDRSRHGRLKLPFVN